MSLHISRAEMLVAKAMDYRAQRQDMIASNIANADTPNYKPRDIRFEEALVAKQAEIMHNDSHQLKMAQTDKSHLASKHEESSIQATLYFRDGHMARNDGNSVDIDVETTEMSKNSIMFTALISGMKKDMASYMSVIDASQKVN